MADSSITAFVPARSQSKRLPGKNVRPFCGKPLVVWTLEACVRAPAIEEVIFSTDSEEYWNIARAHIDSPKLVWDHRAADDAADKVKIFDYLRRRVDEVFGARGGRFLMALPTMPLRSEVEIAEVVALADRTGQAVFSAAEYTTPVSLAFRWSGVGAWAPLSPDCPMVTGHTRSQEQEPAYHPNGAIYLRPIADLRDASIQTLYQGAVPYVMPRSTSADIDTELDFAIAELLMERIRSSG